MATATEGEFFSAFASTLGRAILEATKARQRDGNPSSRWPLSERIDEPRASSDATTVLSMIDNDGHFS